MLFEYYSIRMKDAEPGKAALHVTPHFDEVHSSIKHFKEKHPDKNIVAYKHEVKKGPMGMTHKRKVMFGKDKPASDQVSESTKSFKTLMRSIEDKKSIKNLKVPSPAERKEMDKPKPAPVQEAVSPMLGKTVHSVTHGEDTYTIHDMGSPSSTSAFKVRRNGTLLSNHASSGNAHLWLKSHIASKKNINESTTYTHMVHVQGEMRSAGFKTRLKSTDGVFHKETDKGALFKFKNKEDAKLFSTGLKHYEKNAYAGDVYHIDSNKSAD